MDFNSLANIVLDQALQIMELRAQLALERARAAEIEQKVLALADHQHDENVPAPEAGPDVG